MSVLRLTPAGWAACGYLPEGQAACVCVVIPPDDYRTLHDAGLRYGGIPGVLPGWLSWCADGIRDGTLSVVDGVCTPVYAPDV